MSTNNSSIYVRFGLLPIYRSDQWQDFQKVGYYNNWKLSALPVPYNLLVSFRTPPLTSSVPTISEFKAQKIAIKGQTITVASTLDLTTNDIAKESFGNDQCYFYREQQSIYDENFLDLYCIYRLYLKASNDTEWYSHIFVTVEEDDLYLSTESGIGLIIEGGTYDGQYIKFQP